jgi:hypothetical protein
MFLNRRNVLGIAAGGAALASLSPSPVWGAEVAEEEFDKASMCAPSKTR